MTGSDKELDAMIAEALETEDKDLLDRFGTEPGYFAQAFALFRGPFGWVMWLGNIMNIVFTGIAVWAGWHFFTTTDPIMALRWGLVAVVMINVGLFFKAFLGHQMLNNRVIREVKRLELQLARGLAHEPS